MTNFLALDTLTIYSNSKFKIRVLIQTLGRNTRIQMDLSKNKHVHFSEKEAINYIPRIEKRYQYESSGSLSSPMLPILSWKLKIIAYRGSSTIHPSSKLVLLCLYKMTSSHYMSQRAPSQMNQGSEFRLWFFCFLCKTLPKRLKFNEVDIYMPKVGHQKGTRTRCEICPKLMMKAPKRR